MSAPPDLVRPASVMPASASPSGRALLDGTQCQTGERVKAGDLLAVNFDVRDLCTGGRLHLVQSRQPGREWRGCQFMMRTLTGVAIDRDGCGDWVTVADLGETAFQVVGAVETVYRPTNLS